MNSSFSDLVSSRFRHPTHSFLSSQRGPSCNGSERFVDFDIAMIVRTGNCETKKAFREKPRTFLLNFLSASSTCFAQ